MLTWADGTATAQERSESDAVTDNLSAVVTGGAASAPPAGAIFPCGQRGAVQQRLKSSSRKSRLVDEAGELDAAAKRREGLKWWWQ